MDPIIPPHLLSAFMVGVACGGRPILALTVALWLRESHGPGLGGDGVALLIDPRVTTLLLAGVIFELIVDRRTAPTQRWRMPEISLRLLCGSCAGVVSTHSSGNIAAGATIAFLGVLVGTFGGIELRQRLARFVGSHRAAGIAEDACVVAIAVAAVNLV